jgi:hypothetical protein
MAGPYVMVPPRLLCSLSTARSGLETEAEAMLETVVVVALCQDLLKQRQCQAAGRGSTFSEGLVFQQVQRQEGGGRVGAWAGESGTAVPRLSL